MKYLIINADDFGYSKGINRGIIEAMNEGVVTSTSVMVYGDAVDDVGLLHDITHISVGLHVHMEHTIPNAQEELNKQIDIFTTLFGSKPDHIDVHKPRSSDLTQLLPLLREYSKEHKTPVRELGHAKSIKDFFGLDVKNGGTFDANRITVESLLSVLEALDEGVSEIMCHVGYADDALRNMSSYSDARETELRSLTDERILNYIHNTDDVTLVNWKTAPINLSL